MPKIDKIDSQADGQPKVKIEDSPKLTNFNQFLPKDWESCSQSASAPCQIDQTEEKEESTNIWVIVGPIIGVVVVLLILLGIGILVYCLCKKKKTKKTDPPTWKVLDAIQQRFPITTNMSYLLFIVDTIMKLPRLVIHFRILLRGEHSQKDVDEGRISKDDLDLYNKIRDKKNRIESNRIGVNRPVFLVSEKCQQYSELFFNAVSESAELQKADNEKQKKKMDRTKAGKSKEVSEETKNEGSKELPKEEKGKSRELSKETSKEVANDRTKKSKEVTKETTKELPKKESKQLSKEGKDTSKELSKEKSKELVKKKSKELPTKEKKKKTKPRKESTNKTQKTKLLHIGPGFAKAMKYNKNVQITPVTDANGQPYTKDSEYFENLKCSLILMEYTDANGAQKLEVELMEMIVPEVVIGQLRNLIKCPWVKLLYYAWQNNIVIHTSVPDYLVLSCYFYTTIDLFNYRIQDPVKEVEVDYFPLITMYPIYHKIFSGKDLDESTENDFDEITAFTIFIACMMEWYVECMRGVQYAQEMQQAIQRLMTADEFIHSRWKDKKTDKVQWHRVKGIEPPMGIIDDEDSDEIERKEKKGNISNMTYYQRNQDTTPYHLSLSDGKFEYCPPVKYDETLDNLNRENEPSSVLLEPKVETPAGDEKRKKKTSRKCDDNRETKKEEEMKKKQNQENVL